MTPQTFRIRLYSEASEELVGTPFDWPGLPVPGMIIFWEGGAWRVESIQAAPASPGSIARRDGAPVIVDVIASSAQGIFRL